MEEVFTILVSLIFVAAFLGIVGTSIGLSEQCGRRKRGLICMCEICCNKK